MAATQQAMASATEALNRGQGVWSIEQFQLDEASRCLRAAGSEELLDRSAFQVLHYLLLNAGEVCTHDELLDAGWPGRVVTGNSLNKCISRLRRALADDDGRVLQVVHGFGYRLTATVAYRSHPPAAPPAAAFSELDRVVPGRPGWWLERKLGQGGSGAVYLARHAEQPPRAYKFSHDEAGLRALKREVALFRLIEQQYPQLAGVDPLLDWNLESPPFFLATAYHPRGNLAEWAHSETGLAALNRAARIELAAQIADAVASLHEADIAHRDLKPENLYLIGDGAEQRVLIGDLGIGTGLLPPGVDALGLALGQATRHGESSAEASSGAFRHTAPEVLAGQAATARSDIYALGVMLFQIIVGDLRRPLAPGWHLEVDDDLLRDDIAEAAHIDPAHRLPSARLLAERLRGLPQRRAQRLAGQQLQIELTASRERVQRARRRWRLAAYVAVLLGVGLLFALGFGWRAEQAQRRAEAALAEAQAVRDFLTQDLLRLADPYSHQDRTISLKAAVDAAAAQLDRRARAAPEGVAAIERTLADVYQGWGEFERASGYLDQSLQRIRQRHGADGLREAELQRDRCALARLAGQLQLAAAACAEAARIERRRLGAVDDATLVEAAKLDYENGACAAAVQQFRSINRRWRPGELPPDHVADAFWYGGLCLTRLGRFAESRGEFEALLPIQIARYGGEHPQTAWAHMDYAETLIIAGDFAAAQPHLETAERIFRERLGEDHVDSQLGRYHRGRIALWSGDAAAAVAYFTPVLQRWTADLGPTHLWTLFTQAELAWALAETGQAAAARELWSASQRLATPVLANNPQIRSFFREMWARSALALGQIDAAAEQLPAMESDLRASLPDDHPRLALRYCLQAEVELQRGQPDPAASALTECQRRLQTLPEANYRRQWAAAIGRRLGGVRRAAAASSQ